MNLRSAILSILLFCCVNVVSGQRSNNNEKELLRQFNLLNGQPFPQLQLEDEQGNLFNTTWLKGKTLYIDFWFTQCPPCVRQLPYAAALKERFRADTNIVFVNICIENLDRKEAWKQMIHDKMIKGVNLFYARNRPQQVNLIRDYFVTNFPTYMLVNSNLHIIGHNAPAPSDEGLAEWCIRRAAENVKLSDAYLQWKTR